MAFVNEYIPQEDLIKYDLDAINLKYLVGGTHARDWTIDRERNVYIRNVANGREEFFHESIWTLFYMNQLIEFGLSNISHQVTADGVKVGHKKLRYLNLPDQLLEQKEEVISVIKEALTAYKDGGVFAMATRYAIALEV